MADRETKGQTERQRYRQREAGRGREGEGERVIDVLFGISHICHLLKSSQCTGAVFELITFRDAPYNPNHILSVLLMESRISFSNIYIEYYLTISRPAVLRYKTSMMRFGPRSIDVGRTLNPCVENWN